MSTAGEFYPSSANDNCILDNSFAGTGTIGAGTLDAIYRGIKFGDGGTGVGYTHTVNAGGDSGLLSVGIASQLVNTGIPPSDPFYIVGMEVNQTYLRFDTSSLDDDVEITGVKLGLYMNSKSDQHGFSSPSLRIFAGLTGASDRPTFSSPITNSADRSWFCESAGGCGSGTCSKNEGATDVGTYAQSSVTTGARNLITLSDGTNLDDGSSTSYNDWVNRTGYTYILVTHNTIANTSSSTICNNYVGGDTCPISLGAGAGLETTAVTFTAGTSGNAPYLQVNSGKSQFQMII